MPAKWISVLVSTVIYTTMNKIIFVKQPRSNARRPRTQMWAVPLKPWPQQNSFLQSCTLTGGCHHSGFSLFWHNNEKARRLCRLPCLNDEQQLHLWIQYIYSAAALAFEEMRTPYTSRREICVQKFQNAYQRKQIEKRMMHSESTFGFVKRFSEIKCSSQMMHAFLSQYSCAFRDRLCHVLFCAETEARLIFAYGIHTARFLCMPYTEICVNTTTVYCVVLKAFDLPA